MTVEALNSDQRLFTAQMSDGSQVQYKVVWHGTVEYEWWESGKPSTTDHWVDDRQCHWNVTGKVVRTVAVVIAGQDYISPNLTTVFNRGQANQGSDFVLLQLRSENCGDCAARRDSDFQNMRNDVNGSIPGIIQADLAAVQQSIQGQPGVLSLNLN